MPGSRAFQKRSPRGRCPSCGKKGLGEIKHSMVGRTAIAFRACRYCGGQVTMEPREESAVPAAPTAIPGDGARPTGTHPAVEPVPASRDAVERGPAPTGARPTAELRSRLVAYTAAWVDCDGRDLSAVDAAMARVSDALDALDARLAEAGEAGR